jgi:type II secretory pathway component GspD/PulD (secretin)
MNKVFLLLFASFLASCSMDYNKGQSRPERTYDFSNDQRQEDPRNRRRAYEVTRDRQLSGSYQQAPSEQSIPEKPVVVAPVKKAWVDPNRDIARRYPLKSVAYQQIEEMVKAQLSATGGVSFIKQFNSILVLDKPAIHEKVKVILDAVVRDAVNVRIDIEFASTKSFEDYGIVVKHNGISVNNGKVNWPDKARVDIRGASGGQQTNTKQMLTTMSGHAANLWVTNTVVDKQIYEQYRFIPFHGRFGGQAIVLNAPQVREVGTSLYIMPIYSDDGMVTVELFPVLTTEVGGKQQSFRVEKISTRVTARPGQRVFLGGMNKATSNFFKSIFNPIGAGKSKVTDLTNIYVTPYILKRGSRR